MTRNRGHYNLKQRRFILWPLLACILCMSVSFGEAGTSESASSREMKETMLITNFGPDANPWRNVDDVVMGGVSSSSMRIEEGVAVFKGEVSLENNGGFASVRSGVLSRGLDGRTGGTPRA